MYSAMQLISTIIGMMFISGMTQVNGGVASLRDMEDLLNTQDQKLQLWSVNDEEEQGPRRYALVIPLDEKTTQQLSEYKYQQIQEQLSGSDEEQRAVNGRRIRRQLSGGVTHDNRAGTTVNAQATGTMWRSQDGQGRLNANGHWERTYNTPGVGTGPSIYGGGVTYDHATRGGGGVDVTRTPIGTQVTAQGRGTVWQSQDRNSRVEAHGDYSRNFGGRYGTGRPSYGVGATYIRRFR